MKMPMFALAAALLLPSMAPAASVILDYNEDSYTSSVTGTFDIGTDYGPIDSAQFSLYIAGRRNAYNNSGYGWYYDNDTSLSADVINPWSHESLPGTFELYTFELTDSALAQLETAGTFTFTITSGSVWWASDYGSSGYTTSRFYLDYATLDFTAAPVPEPASIVMGSVGLALVIARRRRAAA